MKSFIKWIIMGVILVGTTGCDTNIVTDSSNFQQSGGKIIEPILYFPADKSYGLEELYDEEEFSSFMSIVPEPGQHENVKVFKRKENPSKDILKFTKMILDEFPELLENDVTVKVEPAPMILDEYQMLYCIGEFNQEIPEGEFEFLNITNGENDDMYIFICHYMGNDKDELLKFQSIVTYDDDYFETCTIMTAQAEETKIDYEMTSISAYAREFGVIIFCKEDKTFDRTDYRKRLQAIMQVIDNAYIEYTY